MSEDDQLMLKGCSALLRVVFGNTNWKRLEQLKQQTNHSSLNTFLTWMLDLVEYEMSKSCSQAIGSEYNVVDTIDLEDEQDNIDATNEQVCSEEQQLANTESRDVIDDNWQMSASVSGSESYRSGNITEQRKRANREQDDSNSDIKQEYFTGSQRVEPKSEQQVEDDNFDSLQYSHDNSEQYNVDGSSLVSGDVMAGSSLQVDVVYNHENESFQCSLCSVSLSDIEVVKEHLKIRHPTSPLILTCLCCSYKFSSLQDYVEFHTQKALQSGSPRSGYVCHICAKTYTCKTNLDGHIKNKHQKSAPSFICPYCQKGFRYSSSLSAHKKRCSQTF